MTSVRKHFLHRGYGAEFEMEADWVCAHLPAGVDRIVDVGCGIGSLLSRIGAQRTIGVDICAEGLAHTAARLPSAQLVRADALRLPFAGGSLGGITAQHVVEHLRDCERACREWFRVLRPGGILFLLTPNGSFCDPSVYADETHVRVFDHHDLKDVLVRAGFTIVDLRTVGLSWFRRHRRIPSGWRLRRFVTRRAHFLSAFPRWRWKGQTLCCAARREPL